MLIYIMQVYFGFTHCPDICPEELDKMAQMLDLVSEKLPPSNPRTPDLLPVFITCDPARDTPSVLKRYLAEFHPNLIGLTGTWEQIKAVCRSYRVYFSTPPGVKPGMDYLVDHSIYFYLMGELLHLPDRTGMFRLKWNQGLIECRSGRRFRRGYRQAAYGGAGCEINA